MTLVKAIKKALVETLKDEKEIDNKKKGDNNIDLYHTLVSQFSNEENPAKKIKELEALIFQLSGKITIMIDKMQNLENQIVNLATVHEELLHVIDSNFEELSQEEDKVTNLDLNSKESKFGLN